MSRGQIWQVDLDPTVGNEAAKTRPALIVGRPALTRHALRAGTGVVTVVPLTTNTMRVFDFQVLVTATDSSLPHDSKAQAEQLRTVSVRQLVRQIGAVPEAVSQQVDSAIRLYLGL